MIEPSIGTEQSYKNHRAEAKVSTWLRNISFIGVLAMTEYLNTYEMTRAEHIGIASGGTAVAFIVACVFEKDRRYAVDQSHLDAAMATNDAKISGEPVPEWAEGNTGNILKLPKKSAGASPN